MIMQSSQCILHVYMYIHKYILYYLAYQAILIMCGHTIAVTNIDVCIVESRESFPLAQTTSTDTGVIGKDGVGRSNSKGPCRIVHDRVKVIGNIMSLSIWNS